MGKHIFFRIFWLIVLVALPNVGAPTWLYAQAADDGAPPSRPAKVTLGAVEEVILNPWGVSFPARIDTGADFSSLDARDIVVRDNIASFKLGKRFGGLKLQLPVVDWRYIQTSMGTEKRPVVEISLCLGSKLFRTPATLKDRSEMVYPFLVGRSALNGKFLVDTSLAKRAHPVCSEASLASARRTSSTQE